MSGGYPADAWLLLDINLVADSLYLKDVFGGPEGFSMAQRAQRAHGGWLVRVMEWVSVPEQEGIPSATSVTIRDYFAQADSHSVISCKETETGLEVTIQKDGLLDDQGKQVTDKLVHTIPHEMVPDLLSLLQGMKERRDGT
jgi:hypothetical protein